MCMLVARNQRHRLLRSPGSLLSLPSLRRRVAGRWRLLIVAFTDEAATKKRPAVIFNGDVLSLVRWSDQLLLRVAIG